MKHYQPGFAPINFLSAGKKMFVIGILLLILKLVDYILTSFSVSNLIFYFGIGFFVIGGYLILSLRKHTHDRKK